MSPWLRRTPPASPDARKWMESSPPQEAAEALGKHWERGRPRPAAIARAQRLENPQVCGGRPRRSEPDLASSRPPPRARRPTADAHPDVRDRSAWALAEIEDAIAVAPLLKTLHDSEACVRARAAWALGEIEHLSAVKGLAAGAPRQRARSREIGLGPRRNRIGSRGRWPGAVADRHRRQRSPSGSLGARRN